MKRSIRTLTALLVLPLLAGLLQFGPFADSSQLTAGGSSKIHPDVLAALQTQSEAGVIISLQGPDGPLAEATLGDLIDNTATGQANVLGALGQDDFTLGSQFAVVAALVGALTSSGAGKLAQHPDVAAVHLNDEILPVLDESVPFIHADEAHNAGITGTGIDVAVFDTGIDTDHPDLLDSLAHEHCFVYDQFGPRPDLCPGLPDHPAEDGNDHGTHVSGIVTSDGDNSIAPTGVAPGVRIHAYKVLSDGGSLRGTWGGVLAATDHLLSPEHLREIEFTNFSIRGRVGVDYLAGECEPPVNPLEWPFAPEVWAAFQNLRIQSGTVSFAASGNSFFRDRMPFPACTQSVIAVGAVDTNDVVADFSQSSGDLDLLAPGVSINSTVAGGGVTPFSGTSMASPHAVGVAALLLQARPDLNPTAPGLTSTQRLARAAALERRLKLTGNLVTDAFDPDNVRTTPRVDARVALLTNDNDDFDGDGLSNGAELNGILSPKAALGTLFPNPLEPDSDRDGCTDAQELGPNETAGGRRDPRNYFDFMDVPTGSALVRDKIVDIGDINAIVNRFGQNDQNATAPIHRFSDPVTTPVPPAGLPKPQSYHPAFDQGGPIAGLNAWNRKPADGTIDIGDIQAAQLQFGHSCL